MVLSQEEEGVRLFQAERLEVGVDLLEYLLRGWLVAALTVGKFRRFLAGVEVSKALLGALWGSWRHCGRRLPPVRSDFPLMRSRSEGGRASPSKRAGGVGCRLQSGPTDGRNGRPATPPTLTVRQADGRSVSRWRPRILRGGSRVL